MMLETLRNLVNACSENDVEYYEFENGWIDVEILDFLGFDENWDEIDNEFENPDAVENLVNWIRENPMENLRFSYASADI